MSHGQQLVLFCIILFVITMAFFTFLMALESRKKKQERDLKDLRGMIKEMGKETISEGLSDNDPKASRELLYPGPDCLEPHEIEEYRRTGTWPQGDRANHLDVCPVCYSMLEALKSRE